MSYRTEQILRGLAYAGMLAFAIGNANGWAWGILLGVMVWVFLLPFTISLLCGSISSVQPARPVANCTVA